MFRLSQGLLLKRLFLLPTGEGLAFEVFRGFQSPAEDDTLPVRVLHPLLLQMNRRTDGPCCHLMILVFDSECLRAGDVLDPMNTCHIQWS